MMACRVEEIPRGITLRSVGLSASHRQMNRFGCSMNGAAELIHAEERSKQFCRWSSRENHSVDRHFTKHVNGSAIASVEGCSIRCCRMPTFVSVILFIVIF